MAEDLKDYYGDKKGKEKEDIDIIALLKLVITVLVDVNKQKGQNTVLTNGNNNEVQIPNEQGPGSVVQV